MAKRSIADGRFKIPNNWPSWKKRCSANRSHGRGPCTAWAVVGMPTCRRHGSGGEANARLGRVRYMCWVITNGPQDMPVALACEVALAVFAEAVLKRGEGTIDQQIKAAMWLTEVLGNAE